MWNKHFGRSKNAQDKQILQTLSLILSNIPCKDSNARFTTVPFKPLSKVRTSVNFSIVSIQQEMRKTLFQRNQNENKQMQTNLIHPCSDIAFKGTFVNWSLSSLHWGSILRIFKWTFKISHLSRRIAERECPTGWCDYWVLRHGHKNNFYFGWQNRNSI